MVETPRSLAYVTSPAGVRRPSEAVEWQCRSTLERAGWIIATAYQRQLAPFDHQTNGGALLIVDCDVDEGGHANRVDLGFEQILPGDGNGFDRLIGCACANCLNFGPPVFAHDPGDGPCYGTRPRFGRDLEDFRVAIFTVRGGTLLLFDNL